MQFCLITKYENGECATIVDTPDLCEALTKFEAKRLQDRQGKSDVIPRIVEARLVRVV